MVLHREGRVTRGMEYESPRISVLGSIEELTLQFDKIGDEPDFLTPQNPLLDGSIVRD
jgi:hypothetical protein